MDLVCSLPLLSVREKTAPRKETAPQVRLLNRATPDVIILVPFRFNATHTDYPLRPGSSIRTVKVLSSSVLPFAGSYTPPRSIPVSVQTR